MPGGSIDVRFRGQSGLTVVVSRMSAYDLERKLNAPGREWSHPRHRDEGAHLRLLLAAPAKAAQVVEGSSRQVLLRHQTELFFHFGIGHRVLEMSAVIFDTYRLAAAGLQ